MEMFKKAITFALIVIVLQCHTSLADDEEGDISNSDGKEIEKAKETSQVLTHSSKQHRPRKPHRLSKRFIQTRDVYAEGPIDDNIVDYFQRRARAINYIDRRPTASEFISNYRIRDNFKRSEIENAIKLAKVKRFFGYMPAKQPRRKDMPPRLADEYEPRYVRALFPTQDSESSSISSNDYLNQILLNRARNNGDTKSPNLEGNDEIVDSRVFYDNDEENSSSVGDQITEDDSSSSVFDDNLEDKVQNSNIAEEIKNLSNEELAKFHDYLSKLLDALKESNTSNE